MGEVDRARDALFAIPPDLPRDRWHEVGRSAISAGLTTEDLVEWSRPAANFKSEQDVGSAFRNITVDGGTGPGTLFKIAAEYGHRMHRNTVWPTARKSFTRHVKSGIQEHPDWNPVLLWDRFDGATAEHPYIVEKAAQGVPLEGLRVVPSGDPLHIMGESMCGALVLPVNRPDGSISSLQFVTPPQTANRLKAKGKASKPNLPGTKLEGWLTVGEIVPGGVIYVCEGIGAAWSCWQSTGSAAVVCFGWGRVRTVTQALRKHYPTTHLVLVPDVGKEVAANQIALHEGCSYVTLPEGWEKNADVNDLAQRDGGDVLAALLESAIEPPMHEPRYKLLSANDLRDLPPLAWRVRGVLPAVGLAGLYGPSASGKSFLALDMAAAIAEGHRWFDCRVAAAPVVYAALEGEGGFRLRVAAWEAHTGRDLPAGLSMVLQPFQLTEPQDVQDLAAVVPAGAVVFLDTLNRAAPTADENSSKDMGEILSAAKQLQSHINGLVVLVHHTGKDATRGLRGHSSLFAALDAAVEVTRNGERREWKVAKSKDGKDGDAHTFMLKIEALGTDEHGDTVTSCVVVRDTAIQDVQAVKLPQGGNQKLVLDALRSMFKDGATGKGGAPPQRPCIELEAAVIKSAGVLPVAPDRKAERARAAITGLISRGLLGCNDGWMWLV